MELIQILFFSLGTFFGIENARIASWEVIVTIDPVRQTVDIKQKDVFTVVMNSGDSARLDDEWTALMDEESRKWVTELENATNLSLKYSTEKMKGTKEKTLNALVSFNYTDEAILEAFAIDHSEQEFSFINMESWNIQTEDGELDGNYWRFPKNKSFTFSLKPFTDIPSEYQDNKISLYSKFKNK